MFGNLALVLSFVCLTPAAAIVGPPERLLISADDESLGRAIVRSANQHVGGSVELLPKRTPAPPRALQLTVYSDGPDGLMLVLSRGKKLRVVRVLKLSGRHGPFDLAEAVALAITDMRAGLDEQTKHAYQPPPLMLSQGMISRASYPLPLPEPLRPRPEPEPAPEPVEPPPAPLLELEPEPAPLFSGLPRLPEPPRPTLPTLYPPATTVPKWKWQLGVGLPLGVLSLALGGLGAASLMLDGACVDGSCNYRYDGRTAGIVELSLGSAAAVASAGLLGSIRLSTDKKSARLTPIVVPSASTRGAGLSIYMGF